MIKAILVLVLTAVFLVGFSGPAFAGGCSCDLSNLSGATQQCSTYCDDADDFAECYVDCVNYGIPKCTYETCYH